MSAQDRREALRRTITAYDSAAGQDDGLLDTTLVAFDPTPKSYMPDHRMEAADAADSALSHLGSLDPGEDAVERAVEAVMQIACRVEVETADWELGTKHFEWCDTHFPDAIPRREDEVFTWGRGDKPSCPVAREIVLAALSAAPSRAEVQAQALEEWADKTEGHYPPDIFLPMDSTTHEAVNAVLGKDGLPTRDRISADMMRHACKIARQDAARLRENGGES